MQHQIDPLSNALWKILTPLPPSLLLSLLLSSLLLENNNTDRAVSTTWLQLCGDAPERIIA